MRSRANRVVFERPPLPELNKEYTVVDLHFHTRFSDGSATPRELARKARKLGIGVAVTDHNAVGGALEMERYKSVLTIPGIEITTREGAHVLLYFYEAKALRLFYRKEVLPYLGKELMSSIALTMEEVISRGRAYDALVVFAHPYCALYTGVCNSLFSRERQRELLDRVDGVEVINAGNLKKWNLKSTVLGFNLNKAMTAGSDGHNLYQLGKAVTYARTPKDRTAFLDAVRNRENRMMGKEIAFIRKVAANGVKFRRNLKNTSDLMGKNVRYSYALLGRTSRHVKSSVLRLRKNGSA